jgi:ketosteroid isomerase-like protein
MNRRNMLAITATLFTGLALAGKSAGAQQPADIEAVKAAHQSFYKALSARDAKAMEAVWANKAYVINIGPRSKTIAVGYADAVSQYWPKAFDALPKIAVTSTITQVQTDGKIAWVVGTETANLQTKSGESLKLDIIVTNIFEKEGDRWLMVSHHALPIPK